VNNKKIFYACIAIIFLSVSMLILSKFVFIRKREEAKAQHRSDAQIAQTNIQANTRKKAQEKYNLGIQYFRDGKLYKSLSVFRGLCRTFPNSHLIIWMLANCYRELGNMPQAIEYYKKSIALKPDHKLSYTDLGWCYFAIGDFQKGYEVQSKVGIDGSRGYDKGHTNFGSLGCRFYDGKVDIKGKTILIKDEGGFGDMFQWIRFAKTIKEKGAYVIVEARKNIIPLLSNCPYIDRLIPQRTGFDDFDYHIYAGGIFRVLKYDLDDMPNQVPYLYPDKKLEQKWGAILAKDKNFKIGICWDPCRCINPQTGKLARNKRAIPLKYFYPLSKIKNVSLYCLQQRNGLEQVCNMPHDFSMRMFDKDFDRVHGSFSDTAAVMKHLDLVITADTSVAHLAGALGVPVWVMLPYSPDWRWMYERSDSYWYPTMKLFRQPIFTSAGVEDKTGLPEEAFAKTGLPEEAFAKTGWGSVMDQVVSELEK